MAAQDKRVWILDSILWEFCELCELKKPKHALKVLFILSLEAFIADIYHHTKVLQRAECIKYVLSVILHDVVVVKSEARANMHKHTKTFY